MRLEMNADHKPDSDPPEIRDDVPGEVTTETSESATTIEALTAKVANLRDQLLRATAEQQNMRRRAERELQDAVRLAAADLIQDLLPTADNLRRAIESVPTDKSDDNAVQQILAGVAATERGLFDTFERYGIRRLDPRGEPFDPRFHQAVFEDADSDRPAGTVATVIVPGYLYRDRLLRPAMVSVAKGGPPL